MVEFQGKFDENATKTMNMQFFKKFSWLIVLLSLLIIACGVVTIIMSENGEDVGFGIFFIAMGALFSPLIFISTAVAQKSLNKSMSVLSADTTETYQFYPDRLIITQTKKRSGESGCEYEATTNTRYSYLYRVEETPDVYLLRISKMQAHVVRKADLTQGTIEELNEILQNNLGTKFKKLK